MARNGKGGKVVLVDIDGTMVQTRAEHRRKLVRDILDEMGVKHAPSNASVDDFWFGHDRTGYVKRNFTWRVSEFWDTLVKLDHPEFRLQHTQAFPDVHVLRSLREQGYRFGVVTSARPEISEAELALVGGREMFDVVVNATWQSGINAKPHPEGILRCLDKLGVKHHHRKNIPYVGNAPEDVLAARAAGVPEVFVQRGEYKFKGMDQLSPRHCIADLNELHHVLRIYHG